MALRMRKDIKKSSYYVWFLGAQESKGLRGAEYIHPVVKSLVQRERDVEPFKVTLQVSHKGLKIIQNIPPTVAPPGGKPNKSSKPEVIKHFIPHHAVTCVLQDEDIVSCILLLYNPVTKCPVHVHAYRCDSVETAEILRGQLQTLIERPENQKKLGEIETRLRAKGLLLPPPSQSSRAGPNSSARRVHSGGGGSDGRSTSTRESESSGGSSSERLSGVGGHQERIANLYDSLAAELREKLGTGNDGKGRQNAPILLPPRDYDTVHRQKGNLTAIDLRRCLNANIVGVNVKNSRNLAEKGGGPSGTQVAGKSTTVPGQAGRVAGSSGGSSGIGSDHAPSPDGQDRESDPRYLDNQSSSDEDWNEQPSEDSLFLVQPIAGGRSGSSSSWRGPGADLSLPRARRVHSSGIESPSSPSSPVANISGTPPDLQAFRRRRPAEERQRTPSPSSSSNNKKASSGPLSPRDRFKDAKEKFLLLERERLEEQERLLRSRRSQQAAEPPIAPAVLPTANSRGNPYPRRGSWSRSRDSEDELEDRPQRGGYFGVHSPPGRDDFGTPEPEVPPEEEDDIFEHGYGVSPIRRVTRRDSYHQEEVVPVRRGHRPVKPDVQVYRGGRSRGNEDPRIIPHQRYHSPSREEIRSSHPYPSPNRGGRGPQEEDIVPDRRQAAHRYRSPTRTPRRDQDYSPDRRERFLSPTRNPRPQPRNQRKIEEDIGYPVEEMQRYRGAPRDRTPNPTRGHMVLSQQPSFSKDSNSDIPLERYRSPIRNPQPAPRHRIKEEDIIESPEPQRRSMEGRLPRANPFQMTGNGVDKKRRSMFEVLEEERRRNSNELAKEFKRRSYQDGGGSEMSSSDRGGNHSNGVANGRHAGYQELSEHERFPGLDRETARLQHHSMTPQNGGHMNLKKSSGPPPPDVVAAAASRYRHSYAEPHHLIPHPQTNHHHEMLHRTNSSVSSGRVGIAAVHPY